MICRQYLVVISQSRNGASNSIKKRALPVECNVDMLYNSTVASATHQTCYITATFKAEQMNSSGLLFTIGNRESNMGYYNQPLLKDQSYTVHIGYRGIIEVSAKLNFTLNQTN
jgi:hypothetical protein